MKVYILEDDTDDWDLLKHEFLRHHGFNYEFDFFDKSKDLLPLITAESPAVIVLDQKLIGETGYEVMNAIKEVCNDCYFIIVTEHVNEDTIILFLKAGAQDFINKHWNNYFKLVCDAVIIGGKKVEEKIASNKERIEKDAELIRLKDNLLRYAELINKNVNSLQK